MKSIGWTLCLILVFFQFLKVQAKIVEGIIAIVNEDIITLSDLKNYRDGLKQGLPVDDLLINPRDIPDVASDRKKLIDLMINEKVLESEVKRQDLEVTIERVEQEIQKISQQRDISRDQLKQALQLQGIRFSDYQHIIKTRIERQSLVQRAITSKIKITDEEIENAYKQKTKKTPKKVYEYKVAHILFRIDKRGAKAARQRAAAVLNQLKDSPEEFETIAKANSEEENFSNGGVLGTFRTGELVKAMDLAIRPLEEGEFSEIVKTRSGYHILKLVTKNSIDDPSWIQEKEQIRRGLMQKAFKEQFRFWLSQLRKDAYIKIN